MPPPPPPPPGSSGDPAWSPQSWWQQPGYQPPHDHPSGTTVLIVGILSITVCQLLGPVAWVMGHRAQSEIDRNPGFYANRGNVVAGRICGIIGTAVLACYVALVLAILVAVASSG